MPRAQDPNWESYLSNSRRRNPLAAQIRKKRKAGTYRGPWRYRNRTQGGLDPGQWHYGKGVAPPFDWDALPQPEDEFTWEQYWDRHKEMTAKPKAQPAARPQRQWRSGWGGGGRRSGGWQATPPPPQWWNPGLFNWRYGINL
jgi:hypothetical protein